MSEWKRETEISFSSLLSMMNQLRRGHLTPVTQPARHNYLQGEDGGLAGELCTAPSEIGERLKIISVTGPVFVAPSNPLNSGLWSPRCIFLSIVRAQRINYKVRHTKSAGKVPRSISVWPQMWLLQWAALQPAVCGGCGIIQRPCRRAVMWFRPRDIICR